ncbi:cell division protein FtsQ/DivIB [Candidatus Pelagibacter communis]|uniref:cell division protein FtsQ/DivIB n=1 Tax=Pelagibacter ubique TaxID=198252 RepID=UPI00065B4269|nr:cell division protein FtsQ/DivIB [Candidatus Pelagibacter ubique]
MPQRKNKKILIYFFLLILVGSINNNSINNLKFEKIKNINIFGLDESNQKMLLYNLNNLDLKNIFFIKKKNFQSIIESNSIVEEYNVIKKYPHSIDINIRKTNFIARININGKFFLLGSNGKVSNNDISNIQLPYIFGSPDTNEVVELKKIIDQSNIVYSQIDSLYYFKSNRWDLKFTNNLLIKLPEKIDKETLDKISFFLGNIELDNKKILDARIKNQIIILNE